MFKVALLIKRIKVQEINEENLDKFKDRKNKPSAATLHALSRQTAQISGSSEDLVEHCSPLSLQRIVQKASYSVFINQG